MSEKSPPTKREYPALYEKFVPIAIGLLLVVVIAMLVFTVLVGVGALSFS
jgi:hypothetical protein